MNAMKTRGTGAALYCRVSTADQAEHGNSIDMQRSRLEAYAVAAGLEVKAIFIEEAISGTIPLADRPEGKNLVSMISSGEVAHVIFLKLDRAFRSASDALATVERWDRAGIGVHFVDHGGASMNTSSAIGRMIFTMLAGFAQFERDLTSERTAAALAYRKGAGLPYSRTPYGLDRSGDRLTENEEERAILERIRTLRGEGWSLRRIAALLTEEGVPTKRGGRWGPSTLKYLTDVA